MSGYLGTKAVLLSTTAATVSGSSTVGAGLTVDNDGATVLTVDRATSNGTLVDFQKDGSAVGSLGVNGDRIYLTNAQEGIMIDQSANNLSPTSSTGTFNDNAMNLGESGNRWKDLYLSGGVYLGGTGSANQLDDYEEGTWTGTASAGGGTVNIASEGYIKIGDLVHVVFTVNFSGASGALSVYGLPFAATNWAVGIGREDATSGYAVYTRITSGNSHTDLFYAGALSNATPFQVSAGNFRVSLTYSVV